MTKNIQKVYSSYSKQWEDTINKVQIYHDSLGIEIVDQGIILPPKKAGTNFNVHNYFCGGVCTDDGKFVSGQIREVDNLRQNRTICGTYKVSDNELSYSDEEVIFGGVLTNHFGHVLTDSLTRFWYIINNLEKKIVFIKLYNKTEIYDEIFRIIGIKNYKIIETPTKFKRIIVPEEAAHFLSNANILQKEVYKHIVNNCAKGQTKYDKVYFSRMEFSQSDVNEKYYADFFERRGFAVISPEKFSLEEQIHIANNAKEVACQIGTLSHLLLFAKEGTKLYCILRNPSEMIIPQVVIGKLNNIETYYFDGTHNLLPSRHFESSLLFYPTKYFVEFLKDNKIEFTEDEVVIDDTKRNALIYEYLYKWYINYSDPKKQKRISNINSIDLINSLSYAFTGQFVDKKKYHLSNNEKELSKIKEELSKTKKELNNIEKEKKEKTTFFSLIKTLFK